MAPDEDSDHSGDDAEDTGPLRRCIVTRERLPKERLIRFVVGPDRVIVPDIAARLPGRGMWLSARRNVIETACSRGAFPKAARGMVTVPSDLCSVLQALLVRRVSEHLGFARRAGQAVGGFQKAREWLQAGKAALVVQASDGSPEERLRFLAGWSGRVPAVDPLTAAEMGIVFGRDQAVHVVLSPGTLADTVLHEAGRLAGVRATDGGDSGISPDPAASSGNAGQSRDKAPGDPRGAHGVKAGR